MKKMAIVVDSFAATSEKDIKKHSDVYLAPLKIYLDGKEFADGVDVPNLTLLKQSYAAKDAKTSQVSPAIWTDLFEELSEKYEQVIVLPVSPALSGTAKTAMTLAQKYKNIHVIEQIMVGGTILKEGLAIQDKFEKGASIEDVLKEIKEIGNKYPAYVIPMTNDAMIRSGRLGRAASKILTKLKTVPIVGYEDNIKLHKKMIKRSGTKAVLWAIEKILKDFPKDAKDQEWYISHTHNMENVEIAKKILKDMGYTNVVTQYTSSMIAVHVGDGALAIGLRKK